VRPTPLRCSRPGCAVELASCSGSTPLRQRRRGLDSEHRERFGFREFWIEGRDFYLNDTVVQFRPLLLDAQHTDPRLMRLSLEGLLKKNFNLAEYWPGPDSARGSKNLVLRHHWAPVADELGFPLILPILSPDAWFDPLDRAPKPAAFAAWQREAAELWRLTRNSPSTHTPPLSHSRYFCSASSRSAAPRTPRLT
jgi:hypothetical protein